MCPHVPTCTILRVDLLLLLLLLFFCIFQSGAVFLAICCYLQHFGTNIANLGSKTANFGRYLQHFGVHLFFNGFQRCLDGFHRFFDGLQWCFHGFRDLFNFFDGHSRKTIPVLLCNAVGSMWYSGRMQCTTCTLRKSAPSEHVECKLRNTRETKNQKPRGHANGRF